MLIIFLFGCKKETTTNGLNNIYSHWKLTTNKYDSGIYNSHPNNIVYSNATFRDNNGYAQLSCDGFVDSSGTYNKVSTIFISFLTKPSITQTYQTGDEFNLTKSTCYVSLNVLTYDFYSSSNIKQPVNVSVNNGLVSVSLSNIGLIGTNSLGSQKWTASITGNVFEGK